MHIRLMAGSEWICMLLQISPSHRSDRSAAAVQSLSWFFFRRMLVKRQIWQESREVRIKHFLGGGGVYKFGCC